MLSYWKHEDKKAFLLSQRTTSSAQHHVHCCGGEEKGGNPFQWAHTAYHICGRVLLCRTSDYEWPVSTCEEREGVKNIETEFNESKSFAGIIANQSCSQCQGSNNSCFFFSSLSPSKQPAEILPEPCV